MFGRPVEAERTVLWNSLPVVDSQQCRSRVDSQQWRSSSRPSDAALPGSAAACTSCAACKLATASLTYLRRLLFLLSAVEIGGCSFVRLTSGLRKHEDRPVTGGRKKGREILVRVSSQQLSSALRCSCAQTKSEETLFCFISWTQAACALKCC